MDTREVDDVDEPCRVLERMRVKRLAPTVRNGSSALQAARDELDDGRMHLGRSSSYRVKQVYKCY